MRNPEWSGYWNAFRRGVRRGLGLPVTPVDYSPAAQLVRLGEKLEKEGKALRPTEHPTGVLIPGGIPVRSEEGHVYEPWSDGWAVGFKVTHVTTGEVRYVYLNPSSSDQPTGQATVFVYQGDGSTFNDEPLIYVNAF